MKHWVLVCEGLADDPVEALNGRTPLEAAKTPFMDLLAKNGRVGAVSFLPPTLEPQRDTACMAILGYNALDFYTGLAPLEALALDGVEQNDRQIAFRCDFVTALDGVMVDPTAGMISTRESAILMKGLSEKLSNDRFKFYPSSGHKNILIVSDNEMADDLDEMECLSPQACVGRNISKSYPKGRAEAMLRELIEKSRGLLENHDVNRVRIDLNENPANLIWLWGQGKRPKLPSFKERHGLEGIVHSKENFAKGLARAAGLAAADEARFSEARQDFVLVYFSSGETGHLKDLKTKVRFIEDFDANIVGKAVKAAERLNDVRICVTSDTAESLAKKSKISGRVPILIHGNGIQAENAAGFNERTCSQSAWSVEDGWRWLDVFIKK